MRNRKYFFLYPFSLIYRFITDIRNILFDTGILSSREFNIPLICVGNITVGGTGKTPHTEYLVDLLYKRFHIVVLSRGYKRKSKGFRIASILSSAKDIGDEPLQIYKKYPEIVVSVDRDRVNGVRRILAEYPETEVVILDDAYQHRSINPGFSILLTEFNRLITRDYLMPYGRLRERWINKERADVIMVTKTPENTPDTRFEDVSNEIDKSADQSLFFTTTYYKDPVPLFGTGSSGNLLLSKIDRENSGALLVTGIAFPEQLASYLGKYFTEIIHLDFPDHHYFNERDIKKIASAWNNLKSPEKYVITTEKDGVRLRELTDIKDSIKEAIYCIPVGIRFLQNKKLEFDNLILNYVRKNK